MTSEVRKIIHIDMDAFYASVEQRDNPELRGIPLAVGGTGERGVIATASYEARQFGIRSAMSSKVALRKCPILKFVRPNFDKYQQVSEEIHQIFRRYTSIIEPLSLDEAFLDVTYSDYEVASATYIAQQIKNEIKNELDLVASAGVSYNKFLAKIASDMDKPDGLYIITPEEGPEFIKSLPIDKFFGVGKVTAERMKNHSIFTGEDLLRYSQVELTQMFGKMGIFLYTIARGIDKREVISERERKSIGVENTFWKDVITDEEIKSEFSPIFDSWWERYMHHDKRGRTITLKIRDSDFKTITRSFTEPHYIKSKTDIRKKVDRLLKESIKPGTPIRLLGISISGFEEDGIGRQLTIW